MVSGYDWGIVGIRQVNVFVDFIALRAVSLSPLNMYV